MVVKLDAPQTSLDPFGLPWSSCHARHPDEGPGRGNSSRSRYFRISASAPASPPSVFQVLKSGSGGSTSGASNSSSNGHNHTSRRIAGSAPRLTKIQIELQPCRPRGSALLSSPPPLSSMSTNRPRPKKANSAPVVLQSQTGAESKGTEERSNAPSPIRAGGAPSARPLTAKKSNALVRFEGEKKTPVFCFPREAFPPPSTLAIRPQKRGRALNDVDGPGTGGLSCKKRRLRLRLVTSRLSQPYSWPATHILNRESGDDDAPVLSRFLKFAALRSLKKAGHQNALVRKAAILNRVRIGVRQAAVLRGHTVIAGMAARGNSLSHGLQLVTTSNSATGALFPGVSPNPSDHPMPPAWRAHTTTFHTSPPRLSPPYRNDPRSSMGGSESVARSPTPPRRSSPSPRSSGPAKFTYPPPPVEEDDGVAFPSADLETRYADLSDDDMDDVYADFGVLFGPGAHSPEHNSSSGETDGEHFYEEYLDELDGIRWIA
ncbi:uncharacterized protein F4822DRAFT_6682 [Hypoxylon trugodes]|uniref:uncharacterized protein n=1 Tax=Hypoxylon trugodes TaxID=326681 RepID=UPI00219ECA3D|nr:uncharacterized protein F4822DRAFT_6682 [Hypoxylon trugodes]KAI1393292.1 hypothetical protein F4822DRAFT_6682 [Hypoxylon trugodes]